MNILNVNMSVDRVLGGGTAERTLQISQALVELGHSCTILTLDTRLSKETVEGIRRRGVRVELLRCLSQRFYLPVPSFRRILRAVDDADVVHIMGHWTIINVLAFIACKLRHKPYVVCPAGALPIFGRSKTIKGLYNILIGKRIVQEADACVAVTEKEISSFQRYGISPERVTIIPNGVSAKDFACENTQEFKLRYGIQGPMILFMGRLNSIKGPDLLLQAFLEVATSFPDFELVFAGPDGGMLANLQKRAAQHQARLHFLGYVGGDEKSQAYHAADFLAIPSRQEAMSIVVLEAGVVATPVLITDQCGFDDVEAVGGGKVVPATSQGLREGLQYMMGCTGRELMGVRLNEYVMQHFQWQQTAHKYLDLYQDLLRDEQ